MSFILTDYSVTILFTSPAPSSSHFKSRLTPLGPLTRRNFLLNESFGSMSLVYRFHSHHSSAWLAKTTPTEPISTFAVTPHGSALYSHYPAPASTSSPSLKTSPFALLPFRLIFRNFSILMPKILFDFFYFEFLFVDLTNIFVHLLLALRRYTFPPQTTSSPFAAFLLPFAPPVFRRVSRYHRYLLWRIAIKWRHWPR